MHQCSRRIRYVTQSFGHAFVGGGGGGHDILISFGKILAYETYKTRSQLFDMKCVHWRLSNDDGER